MEERERACDEEVLRNNGEPRAHTEGILKICELYLVSPLACVAGVTGHYQYACGPGASSSPVTFNLPCMPVRFFKAQPNEDPPGLRREEIRHPRSPGGLVARHDGRSRVAVEIEAHCDKCFLAGGARGSKYRTRSGQIDA
jgi:hypothetical protein